MKEGIGNGNREVIAKRFESTVAWLPIKYLRRSMEMLNGYRCFPRDNNESWFFGPCKINTRRVGVELPGGRYASLIVPSFN